MDEIWNKGKTVTAAADDYNFKFITMYKYATGQIRKQLWKAIKKDPNNKIDDTNTETSMKPSLKKSKREVGKKRLWSKYNLLKAIKDVRYKGMSLEAASKLHNVPFEILSMRLKRKKEESVSDRPQIGKRKYRTWSKETLEQALDDIKKNGSSIKETSELHEIPIRTLYLYSAEKFRKNLIGKSKKREDDVKATENQKGERVIKREAVHVSEDPKLVERYDKSSKEHLEAKVSDESKLGKRKYRTWGKDTLYAAISDIRENGISLKEASEWYDIPAPTLSRYTSGKYAKTLGQSIEKEPFTESEDPKLVERYDKSSKEHLEAKVSDESKLGKRKSGLADPKFERGYRKWSKEHLHRALRKIKSGMPTSRASKKYGIPVITLHRYLSGQYDLETGQKVKKNVAEIPDVAAPKTRLVESTKTSSQSDIETDVETDAETDVEISVSSLSLSTLSITFLGWLWDVRV